MSIGVVNDWNMRQTPYTPRTRMCAISYGSATVQADALATWPGQGPMTRANAKRQTMRGGGGGCGDYSATSKQGNARRIHCFQYIYVDNK